MKNMWNSRTSLLFIAGLSFLTVHCASFYDGERLLGDLFQNYSTDIRPNQNLSEATKVSVHPFIFSLNDFNEVSGVISIVGGLSLKWHDFRLNWTPSNYGDIEMLPIPKKKLWVPSVFLINPANKMEAIGDDDYIGRVSYSGIVQWSPVGLLKSLCNVNMYNFPFDTQSCFFTFALWGFLPSEAILMPGSKMSTIDTSYYSSNTLWELENTEMKYSKIVKTKNIIELRINLKRRALYFVINMLAPILLLSILNPLVFALPVESGERVSYAITIFLSFAVFLTLISENMPKTSEPMSLLSYFLIVTMTMSTLICILTVVTMRFHYRDSSLKVSKTAATVLKILQLNFFRIPCNMCKRKSQIRVASKLDDRFVQNVKDGKVEPLTVEQVVEDTWKIVASQYDQVLMYYFFVVVFLQWIMLLIVISI
ncbi:neuronal acetylcholine receptor subunit alpha-6-like [Magallana gigas]|uniref:neuronal acetylcholine receptor subunit alpha-6-like n=1 Tax=Magallana gigas TaxID=29159 RepID=UPI0033422DE6